LLHCLSKDLIKDVDTLISDTKFNIDLFNQQEMTSDEINMIYNRSMGLVNPQRTGNLLFDYKASQEGGTWPGEYLFANTCRDLKLQKSRQKLNIMRYLEQLRADLQQDLGLNPTEALQQTKH
jgi:hypothetical protein